MKDTFNLHICRFDIHKKRVWVYINLYKTTISNIKMFDTYICFIYSFSQGKNLIKYPFPYLNYGQFLIVEKF